MSHSSELNQARVINELRQFLKKVLLEPGSLDKTLEIAQRHAGKLDFFEATAKDISRETVIKIPDNPAKHSDADKLYLELLKEVVDEGSALY